MLLGYLLRSFLFYDTGLSPSVTELSNSFLVTKTDSMHYAQSQHTFQHPHFEKVLEGPTTPVSMLTGLGSSAFARRYLRSLFDFFSSGYLDVSVHQVPSNHPMCSGDGCTVFPVQSFLIRIPPDHRFCAAPRSVSPLTRPSSAICP